MIFAEPPNTFMYGFKMSKWNAGVRSLRARAHFFPSLVKSPSPCNSQNKHRFLPKS